MRTGKKKTQILLPGAFEKERTDLIAHVQAQKKKGEANLELVRLLAGHFKIPPNRVRIIAGKTSNKKTVEIQDKQRVTP